MKPKIDSFESERLVLEVREEHHANQLYDLFLERDFRPFEAFIDILKSCG